MFMYHLILTPKSAIQRNFEWRKLLKLFCLKTSHGLAARFCGSVSLRFEVYIKLLATKARKTSLQIGLSQVVNKNYSISFEKS